MRSTLLIGLIACAGCGAVIEPGHRGLLFKSRHGGLQHEVLTEGYHHIGLYGRIDDFDVTYSTKTETMETTSSEGLAIEVKVSIIYRPVVAELYDLDAEIGLSYFDEVVGPEWRTATRGVFARHSYYGLQQINEKLEDEIEAEVRRRIAGKHVEISSVTMESITGPTEITNAVQARLVAEQESKRKELALQSEAKRRQLELEHEAEREKLKAEAELTKKSHERQLAEQQAAIEKVQAEAAAAVEKVKAQAEAERAETEAKTQLIKARADAQEAILMAKAHMQEKRAEATAVTPLTVMMHAYDALGKLGGSGTNIMLGDWSKVPHFLFPNLPGMVPALTGGHRAPAADGTSDSGR